MTTAPPNKMPFRPSQLFTEDILQLPKDTLLVMCAHIQGFPAKTLMRFIRVLSPTADDHYFAEPGQPVWFLYDELSHDERRYCPNAQYDLRKGRKASLADKGAQSYGGEFNYWNTTYWLELASWDDTPLPADLAQKRRCSITKSIRETTAVTVAEQLPSVDIVWGSGGKVTPTFI